MLSHIACCDKSMAIGYENNLLYHISEDMKRFKELTTGKLCIQGRLTYESDRKHYRKATSEPKEYHINQK
ncbi:dihydrofolate reductase [Bacillus amyloliquefaciens]